MREFFLKILFQLYTVQINYVTQKMCDEADDVSLTALKLISIIFVTSKIFKNLFNVLYADEHNLYFNEDSGSINEENNHNFFLQSHLFTVSF